MAEITLGRTESLPIATGALPIQRRDGDCRQNFKNGPRRRLHFRYSVPIVIVRKNWVKPSQNQGQDFYCNEDGRRYSRSLWADLDKSLSLLKTDYIDIYQFHNPAECYKPGTVRICMNVCGKPRNREDKIYRHNKSSAECG